MLTRPNLVGTELNANQIGCANILHMCSLLQWVRCLTGWRPQIMALLAQAVPGPLLALSTAFTPVLQVLFKGPADVAVEEVHAVLRSIVASSINSEDCKSLVQYTGLKRDIVQTAGTALGRDAWACMDLTVVHSQGRPGSADVHGCRQQGLACFGSTECRAGRSACAGSKFCTVVH